MRVVIAFDKFKGSLSQKEAAEAAKAGVLAADPAADCTFLPLADGGEGTVDAFLAADPQMRRCQTEITPPHHVPGDEPVPAAFALRKDGLAVLESAQASGLSLVPKVMQNPLFTSSFGTGELIAAALGQGASRILLGLGGSATNDAGCGMAAALGAVFLDKKGRNIPCPAGRDLIRIEKIDLSGLDPRLSSCQITACCDVDNPLYGPDGAACVYAGQKGADARETAQLDEGLRHFAGVLLRDTGFDAQALPGAGAAGGLGAGAAVFLHAALRSGADTVLTLAHADEVLQNADLLLTGEGSLDRQTLCGKAVLRLLARAEASDLPSAVLAGRITEEAAEALGSRTALFALADGPMDTEESMERAAYLLYTRARSVALLSRRMRRPRTRRSPAP